MKDSVRNAFVAFTKKFEGEVSTMYLDVKGLVTVGIGNLIDPVGAALDLPFVRISDGAPASRQEIGAEWRKIKMTPDLSVKGWKAAAAIATLKLTPDGIGTLVQKRLDANEHYLTEMRDRFSEFSSWPADAQLGLLSMAWACGPAFNFPKFQNACYVQDWNEAAAQCHMEDSKNPGLRPRNAADITLFHNAAKSLCYETLYYPDVI